MPSPPRILVIDDDDAVRAAIVAALKNDFTLNEASDVVEAIGQLFEFAPDVVVLDLVLGTVPATRLHDALVRRRVPVLLISGTDYTSLPRVAEANGWPFLAKPFTPDALRRSVQDLLPPVRPATMPPPTRPTKVRTTLALLAAWASLTWRLPSSSRPGWSWRGRCRGASGAAWRCC